MIWDTGSDQSIVSASGDEHCHGDVENLLLCLVLLFGSSFPLFKLLLPLMKYGMGIRCTKALRVSMCCSSAWVGG